MARISDEDFKTIALNAGVLEPAIVSVRLEFEDLNDPAMSVSAFIAERKASGERPHWWPNTFEKDSVDQKLLEAAFGEKRTLKAQGDLIKTHGLPLVTELASDWNCSLNTLTPGRNPKADASDKTAPKKTAGDVRNNPWHKSNWNITAQGKLVAAIGVAKSAAIARSVGSKLGDTRPNPNF